MVGQLQNPVQTQPVSIEEVNLSGGIMYKITMHHKYAEETQSIIYPWMKSAADAIIIIDKGDWRYVRCDAFAHFPGLTLHAEAAVGNVVIKLGKDVYCIRVLSNEKRKKLLSWMMQEPWQTTIWYADKLEKYFSIMDAMEKANIRGIEHLAAIKRAIFD
jgi:hypothetical protein